eukprot:scaffold395737_cov35-Attheya_sp.AAC.1
MSSAPWSKAEKQVAAKRGAHPSTSQYNDLLRSEVLQMCQKSQWTVLFHSASLWMKWNSD